jgi:hypothetical protein
MVDVWIKGSSPGLVSLSIKAVARTTLLQAGDRGRHLAITGRHKAIYAECSGRSEGDESSQDS